MIQAVHHQQQAAVQRLSPSLQAPPFGPRPPCYEQGGMTQHMMAQQQMAQQQQMMTQQQMMNQSMMNHQMLPQGPSGQ